MAAGRAANQTLAPNTILRKCRMDSRRYGWPDSLGIRWTRRVAAGTALRSTVPGG